MNVINVIPIPALSDNYIWVLHNGQSALVCDPSEALPVQTFLQQHQLELSAIVITHHHADHCDGVLPLYAACATTDTVVYLPAQERNMQVLYDALPQGVCHWVQENKPTPNVLGMPMQVYDTPGHTAGHVSYYFAAPTGLSTPILLCGDVLFSAGCGRVFDGTVKQLHNSLQKIQTLPDNTQLCCAHEYTLSNLRFAKHIEPNNADVDNYTLHCQQLRQAGQPTLPAQLGLEKAINPFLRLHIPAVQQAAKQHTPAADTPQAIFAALRNWKNQF